MIAKSIVCAALVLLPVTAFAQSSLSSQINAVNAAVTQEKQDEAAQQAAQQAQLQEQQREEQRAQARRERAAAARRARIEAARRARQAKDEQYQDKLRDLSLQEKQLKLKAMKTRVDRENEMIDQQLKRKAAETDLIQSNADANRNISEGAKSFLDDTGKAELKAAGANAKEAGAKEK